PQEPRCGSNKAASTWQNTGKTTDQEGCHGSAMRRARPDLPWLGLVPRRASADHRQASTQGSADHYQGADALEKSRRTDDYPITMWSSRALMSKEADRWAKVLSELGLR